MKLSLVAALLVLVHYFYMRPEIQALFTAQKTPGDPLAFLNDLPEIKPNPLPEKPRSEYRPRNLQPVAVPSPPPAVEDSEPAQEYSNQVPNDQVQRVLFQILAAKKLANGISLSVTDDKVELVGEVSSAEKRQQILEIIDKGREARRIDEQHLKIKN